MAYLQALAQGFTSSVTGSPVQYGWSDIDQLHLQEVQSAIDKAIDTFPIQYADIDGREVMINDQATLTQLEKDAKTFAWNLVKQKRVLIAQVMGTTTIDEVNVIEWTNPT